MIEKLEARVRELELEKRIAELELEIARLRSASREAVPTYPIFPVWPYPTTPWYPTWPQITWSTGSVVIS